MGCSCLNASSIAMSPFEYFVLSLSAATIQTVDAPSTQCDAPLDKHVLSRLFQMRLNPMVKAAGLTFTEVQ